jgi:anti-anti-sigma regulatory factor
MAVEIVVNGSAGMVLDALARLELTARRWGGEVCVRNPEPALVELLEVCGLTGVLPGKCQRDAEQREQPRVEKRVDPDDLAR